MTAPVCDAPLPVKTEARDAPDDKPLPRTGDLWAMLLACVYEIFPLSCLRCRAPMRIIAFITDVGSVQRILEHIGEPSTPPRIAPAARGPPDGEGISIHAKVPIGANFHPSSSSISE